MAEAADHLEATRRKRPGGRTADVTRRINLAMLELLAEGGIEACTFQNVASRAGVERSTLYRRNPDRWPAIMDAIIELAERETARFDSGSFRDDLAATLLNLAKVLNGPMGPALIQVAGALQSGVAPGQGERFWKSRQRQLAPMFEAAIQRGELPADVDRDELFAMTAGPIYFRKFIASQPLSDAWVRKAVDQVCDRYGVPSRG
ncbi:MAG TPA: TetR/AcrR family transcriptional regulator C-terminal ligand-binding domain-containing protein [Sphingomicrobium sp.]